MKQTVQDVARITGLSISTVRQYSWRMHVGTKVGNKKFFTNAEAKTIATGDLPKPTKKIKSNKPAKKTKPRKPAKKAIARKTEKKRPARKAKRR
jgi:hypothetical protein